MPMKAPRGPSQRSQPNRTAASTATRGAEPSTVSWYSCGAFSNSSQQGIETTAARMPSFANASRAAIAMRDLRTGREQRDLALPISLGQHIGASCRPVLGARGAAQ